MLQQFPPTMNDQSSNQNFLYPRSSYRGKFSPENLVFNANLQEFAQKVSYICNLETAGKISSTEAYIKIRNLWAELEISSQMLPKEDDTD